jgi:zinc protease
MKNKNRIVKIVIYVVVGLLLLSLIAPAIFAQSPSNVRREQLLNGLKLYMLPDTTSDKVAIRIRVNSGSAFDPQGREGLMYMLSRNLFPNQAARDFFAEDLGGSLEINTTYDYIEISASATKDQFLTLLEALAGAVSDPPIERETVPQLQNEQIAAIAASNGRADYVADQAARTRLYGTFPYGRPIIGTAETVRQLVYADLVEARQKFFTADNAVVTIVGNFDRNLASRAAKRFFGGWIKADRKVPSTFRQPEMPDTKVQMITSPSPDAAGVRFAFKTAARGHKDMAASNVLSSIIESRLKAQVPAAFRDEVTVVNEPNLLFGTTMIAFRIDAPLENGEPVSAVGLLTKVLETPITDMEFNAAKSGLDQSWRSRDAALFWLDNETFKTPSSEADRKIFETLKLADVKIIADRYRTAPMAAVMLTRPATDK